MGLLIAALSMALQADVTVVSRYTAGGDTTETKTYISAARQRFETGGAVIIHQCDRKRMIDVDSETKTFSVLPEPAGEEKKPSCTGTPVAMFTGETQTMHGLQAKRWVSKTTCSTVSSVEIEGWYTEQRTPQACGASQMGPGFPLQYVLRTRDEKGASEISYDVTSVDSRPIAPELFEPPAGYTELGLNAALAARHPDFVKATKETKPEGMRRVAIASFVNSSGQGFAVQPFESKLAGSLKAARFESVPIGAGREGELVERARKANADYVLIAELAQLQQTQSGGVGKKLGRLSRLASGGEAKQTYAAQMNYRLLPLNGGQPAENAVTGASSAFGFREAVNLARTVSQFAVPMMAMNSMLRNQAMANMMANPNLLAQGGMPAGGLDPGLGAWQTAFSAMNFASGGRGSDPDNDQKAAINDAVEKLAKAVAASAK